MKKVISIFLIFSMLFVFVACSDSPDPDGTFYDEYPTGDEIVTVDVDKNPVATVTLEDGSQIVIELFYHSAPNTVANFIALAQEGVYDGMAFNMVRNSCIVMMGAAEGDYDPPYYIMDETADDENEISHQAGVVSMIRTSSSDTVTGQFFILTQEQDHFDGKYNAFGYVTEGLDIIEKIAASELDENDRLVAPYIIQSVTVQTYGVTFPKPTIIPRGE